MPQQKLALMARLCRAGYYFRHGGIKWMHDRVQSQGERKKINNNTASPLSLKNIGFVNEQEQLISRSPLWPTSTRENRRWNQVEDRMGGNRAERETLCLQQTTSFRPCAVRCRSGVTQAGNATDTYNEAFPSGRLRSRSPLVSLALSLSDGEGEIKGAPTMNAPPWLEIILTRVSPAVQKSPSMQRDCIWHVVSSVPGLVQQRLATISHDSASGRGQWTMIYARGEAANASQPGITLVLLLRPTEQTVAVMYEQIVRDWPTQAKVWLVISLKVHYLNNVS